MDEVFVILAKANELAQPRKKRNAKNEVSDREWYINGSRWVPVFYLTINKLINPMPGQFTVMDARYNAGESCDNAPPRAHTIEYSIAHCVNTTLSSTSPTLPIDAGQKNFSCLLIINKTCEKNKNLEDSSDLYVSIDKTIG